MVPLALLLLFIYNFITPTKGKVGSIQDSQVSEESGNCNIWLEKNGWTTTNHHQIVTQVHLVWDVRRNTAHTFMWQWGSFIGYNPKLSFYVMFLRLGLHSLHEESPLVLGYLYRGGSVFHCVSIWLSVRFLWITFSTTEKNPLYLLELLQGTESICQASFGLSTQTSCAVFTSSLKPSEACQSESGWAGTAQFLGAQVLKISSFPWSWRKQKQDIA